VQEKNYALSLYVDLRLGVNGHEPMTPSLAAAEVARKYGSLAGSACRALCEEGS